MIRHCARRSDCSSLRLALGAWGLRRRRLALRVPLRSEIIRGGRDLRQGRPLALPGVIVLEHSAQGLDGDVGVDRGGLQALMTQLAQTLRQDIRLGIEG